MLWQRKRGRNPLPSGKGGFQETYRALRVRAAMHGRSTEAEIRVILEVAVLPESRIKFGTYLAEISREVGGFNIEIERDQTPNEPISFE
jgi:plasmid stability protein